MFFATIFSNDLDNPVFIAQYKVIDLNIFWGLNGGVKTYDFKVALPFLRAMSLYNILDGKRIVVTDTAGDRPVCDGFLIGKELKRDGISFDCQGFWFRHSDLLYAFDDTVQDNNALDTEQGTLSYGADGDGRVYFRDTGQDFSDWAWGDKKYGKAHIIITNTDGTITYGWLREANPFSLGVGNSAIAVMKTKDLLGGDLSNHKFAGASVTGKTPLSYTVYASGTNNLTSGGRMIFNEGTYTASFTDTGQSFSSYANTTRATHTIQVWNDDDTVSFGFIGGAYTKTNSNDSVKVYQDVDLTTYGWLGEDPQADATRKFPYQYEVKLTYNYYSTSDVIKDMIDVAIPAISGDTSCIEETDTVIGFWEPPIDDGGFYPSEGIDKLASFSDSQNREWIYWLENTPFNGASPRKPIAHFEPVRDSGDIDWVIEEWMLSGDDVASSDASELRNSIGVIYKDIENDNVIAFSPESGRYEDYDSITQYWEREAIVAGGDSTAEVAELYGELYLNKYKRPILSRAVSIRNPYIHDRFGARYAPWSPIKYGKPYFRIGGLYPKYNSLTENEDGSTVGIAIEMEYSSSDNELKIYLDLESSEIDAIIARTEMAG